MDLIPIQISYSYDGKWTKNEQSLWLHENSNFEAIYIKKTSTLRDLEDAVFGALRLDRQQYELHMKFLFSFNVPNMLPCPCATDGHVAIFIEKQMTNTPMHISPLYVDIVSRPQVVVHSDQKLKSLHRAKTIHARWSSDSGSNHIPFSYPDRGHNTKKGGPSSTVGVSAVSGPIRKMHVHNLFAVPEAEILETQVPETQFHEDPGEEQMPQRHISEVEPHDDFIGRWAYGDVADSPNRDNLVHDDVADDDQNCDEYRYGDDVLYGDDVFYGDDGNDGDDVMHGHTPEDLSHGVATRPVVGERISEVEPPIPYAPYLPPTPPQDVSSTVQPISKDQMYASKQELKKKLSLHAIKNNFEFKVKKSDTGRFDAGCIDLKCTWKLRATKMSGSEFWSIKVYCPDHTCNLNIMHRDHRQASSSVIGDMFRSKFTTSGRQFKPKDLIEDVRRELGANMSYDKAWRAREAARASVYGTPEESYANLPLWSFILEMKNSGSITRIQTDSDNRFQYYFMAIGASIRGFQHMRPVVAVDGTFLKNRYGGILYVAVCLDGNDQIYPLAFGIGPIENDESYLWFFSKFKDAYGDRPDLVFITDRHPSFVSTIRSVFPNAYHGFCAYHLLQNMKAKHPRIDLRIWKSIKLHFYSASRAYLTEDFDRYMGQLCKISSECHQYLMEANPLRWARAHFPGNRFSIMTTNIAESMNAVLRDAREEPIIPLLNRIRDVMQRWFFERRNIAADPTNSPVTKELDKILDQRRAASSSFYVDAVNLYEFAVHGGDVIGMVNLRTKTCSCREFTLDGYPCIHAFAVCKERNISPYTLCDPYYSTDVLQAAYSESIYPLGDPKQWHAPVEVLNRIVLPPLFKRRAGRRRIHRIPSQGEEHIVKKCGRCKRTGHNRKTCTFPVALDSTIDRHRGSHLHS